MAVGFAVLKMLGCLVLTDVWAELVVCAPRLLSGFQPEIGEGGPRGACEKESRGAQGPWILPEDP